MRFPTRLGLALAAAAMAPAATAGPLIAPVARSVATTATLTVNAPNMLGTLALPIKAQRFDAELQRALQDASALPAMQRLLAPARRLGAPDQIAFVQRAVTANIRWASDATEWGQHDYWASAAQTLARGAGDMEDRAIVKMQALRALGFNSGDLFLTIARDKVGGPITVLAVRFGGRYFILDDTGGTPFAVDSRRNEFQPVFSFGMNGAWVHARPAATLAAVRNGAVVLHK